MTMIDEFSEVFDTDVPIEVEAKVCSKLGREIICQTNTSVKLAEATSALGSLRTRTP
jgi:hypothetical protein